MKDLDITLEVTASDYGVSVNLEDGSSAPSLRFAARTGDLPHRYPLDILLTPDGSEDEATREYLRTVGPNVLRPRSQQTFGLCAVLLMSEQAIRDIAPLAMGGKVQMLVLTADRLPDGNSVRVKRLLVIGQSDIDDCVFSEA